MPSRSNFYRWRRADGFFDQQVQALVRAQPKRQLRTPRRGLTTYTPELAARVLARLAAGESMRAIARDPAMPCHDVFYSWRRALPWFDAAWREALAQPRRRTPPTPSKWSEAMAEHICLRIVHGEPVSHICTGPGMPTHRTVCHWARTKPGFARAYEIARDMGAQLQAERVWQIVEALDPRDEKAVTAAQRELARVRRRVQ